MYEVCFAKSGVEDQLDVHQAGADVQSSVSGSQWGI